MLAHAHCGYTTTQDLGHESADSSHELVCGVHASEGREKGGGKTRAGRI